VTVNVPNMEPLWGAHKYVTEPGVKFTVQVSCPVFSTSEAQLCFATQETDSPVRWKLWNVELSSSSSV